MGGLVRASELLPSHFLDADVDGSFEPSSSSWSTSAWFPDPLHREAEVVILDAVPLPTELCQRLLGTLSQLLFPAGLRGRCSHPHFTVELPAAQRAEGTFARLQRKWVAELALTPGSPMSCLRLFLISLQGLPAAPPHHHLHPQVSCSVTEMLETWNPQHSQEREARRIIFLQLYA